MIKLVTITGADDSVTPQDLTILSDDFKFVEWAILFSRSSQGTPRFPSMDWIKNLVDIKVFMPQSLKLSCHLCGAYVRELLRGDITFIAQELATVWGAFDRVQINTHGQKHDINLSKLIEALKLFPEKEFIFQYDNVQSHIAALEACNNEHGVNVSTLFDLSHGAGISPYQWPELIQSIKCGYAGGISPENIQSEIKRVNEKVGSTDTWIDMETHVRSNNDFQFDLAKVDKCLSIAYGYID